MKFLPTCLQSGLTVAAPDAFGRIPGVRRGHLQFHTSFFREHIFMKIYYAYTLTWFFFPYLVLISILRPCMINRISGLKRTIYTCEWPCLISFARDQPSCKEGKQTETSNWKYACMSPPGIEPATLGSTAGHLDRLTIGTVA